ncbi:MAG TPA: hypothetical protein VI861_03730, partial [Rickettsiales bacterium]|nr:hypothetical protein [Rickettsiales bacterium]
TALTIAKMIEANPDLKEEKGAEARKALLGFSTVRDPIAIGAVSEALTISSRGENPVIGRTEAQAALMEMGRESSDPRAIGSVCNAIARINWDHHKDASNDGVATHAFIQEMIGKVEKTPGSDGVRTRGDLAMAIATSCDTQEGRDKFCNKFTKGQILDWSKKAKTNEDIHRFAFALGTMAYHEGRAAESGGLFCGDKEVQGALNDMGNKITAGNGSEEAKAATDLALANVGSTAAVDKAVLQHKEDAQQQPGKDPQDPSAEPLEKRQVEAVH